MILNTVTNLQASASSHGRGSAPLLDTEGGWGQEADLPDRDEQSAFLARIYVLQAGLAVDRFVWYGWNADLSPDSLSWGKIWSPGSTAAGTLLKGGMAYRTISNWLTNAQISSCTNPVTGIWSCNIIRSTGKPAQILWTDSSDYVVYQVAPVYTQWRDLLTDAPTLIQSGVVTLNHKPILVEAQ